VEKPGSDAGLLVISGEVSVMLAIKIISFGCEACRNMEQPVRAALEALTKENPALEATIEQVTDHEETIKCAYMRIPGLMVNEHLVCQGRVPTVDEVTGWMKEALAG